MKSRRSGLVAVLGCLLAAVSRPRATAPGGQGQARPCPGRLTTRFPGSLSATSAPPRWAAASTTSRCSSPIPRSSTSAPRPAACGRRPTTAPTWEVLFDDLDDAVSIGDIAIAPNDANTVWVGTGENNNRQSGSWGNGLYKSIDGGQTWKHMGLRDSKHIARIIVDPIDHDVVYVAALGSSVGPRQRARRLQDHRRRPDLDATCCSSTRTPAPPSWCMDPSNNKVLYAATYQRRRATWGFNGGGPGSAMWKIERRRPHLDQADQRHAGRSARPHRHGRLSRQPEHRLRAHRARRRRAAPIDRTTPG